MTDRFSFRLPSIVACCLAYVLAPCLTRLRAGDNEKVHEVGAGLKINGELGKVSAITYHVRLATGKTYVIDLVSPNQKPLDPILRLLDANGKQLDEDDNGGEGLNARIMVRAGPVGAYQIVATGFGKGTGPFTLTVREATKTDRTLEQHQRLREASGLNAKVEQLHGQGHYAKATDLALQALKIHKEVLGEKHPDVATSLNNLAVLYYYQGNSAKAEPLHRQALAIRKEVLGEKHHEVATSLNNLAMLYRSLGNYAKAELLYRQALDIRKEVLGAKDPDYATTLVSLALLYKSQGNFAKAEPLYLEAAEIYKEVLGEKHPYYATSLNNLAGLYSAQGNHVKAEALYLKAVAIRKEVLGEKHPAYATSLNSLAGLYTEQGNYAQAERLYGQALDIRKAVLGEKHPDVATSLNNLAFLYNAQRNYAKAEPLYRHAMEIHKAVLGEKHPDYATSLNNLALLYDARGNHAKAEPLYLKAMEIRKEVLGEKDPDYAASLNNLALSYKSQGNHAKAQPLYVKALAIHKGVLGEKHPDVATSLNNLALLYDVQGDHAQAEPLYLRAMDIRKEVLGAKHPAYARSLNNLAALYEAQGNHARAEPLYLRALAIYKEVLGEKHPDYAITLNNLAFLYDLQGNYPKAKTFNRQALAAAQVGKTAIAMEDLRPEHLRIDRDTVMILANRALFLEREATKDPTSQTLRACERARLLALEVLERVRQETIDQQESKIHLLAEESYLFPNRIRALSKLFALEQKPEDLEAAFLTAEQGTSRAFLETLGHNRANLLAGVSADLQAEEAQLLQDLRLLDARIDKESARTLQQRDPDLVGKLINERHEIEDKLQQFLGRLEKLYPQYAGLKYPRPCTLEQARACLADDEVALLFVLGAKESFIVLVEARPKRGDKTGGLAIFELPGAATLAEQTATLTDLGTLALSARVNTLARQAYDTLLGPCKDRIQGKHLVIVPGGNLSTLPFELLMDEDGKYLVENHRIRYAPSLTALYFINLWRQKRAVPTEPLFAVGDPVYGKAGAFERLVHSGTEVAAIAKLLDAGPDYVLTRDEASEVNLKEASGQEKLLKARYIHFATHGILGVDRGKPPALVLNLVGNKSDDGFLEMDEIANLKLNADLVVLSACRTGQGRMARGEGVSGLARMFLYAGSQGVVCSLWSVDDRETSNLMVSMYGQLKDGRSAAEALRHAKLEMIRAGKGPLYWAPFVLIGE